LKGNTRKVHEPQQANRWKELPEDEDIIRSTQVMVIAKDLERHDEIERMIEEGFAINEVKVIEIEDGHLISLVHLWRYKNIEEKKERPRFRPKA
jgi:hypothetical protein